MPKDIKTLGNNKARACESLGFVHKKRLCQRFDTTSCKNKACVYRLIADKDSFAINQKEVCLQSSRTYLPIFQRESPVNQNQGNTGCDV